MMHPCAAATPLVGSDYCCGRIPVIIAGIRPLFTWPNRLNPPAKAAGGDPNPQRPK